MKLDNKQQQLLMMSLVDSAAAGGFPNAGVESVRRMIMLGDLRQQLEKAEIAPAEIPAEGAGTISGALDR